MERRDDVDLDAADADDQSIHDLISYLKSAFLRVDFDKVERILVSREARLERDKDRAGASEKAVKNLKAELEKKKLEVELISEKNGNLAMEKCLLEDDVRRMKSNNEHCIVQLKNKIRDFKRAKKRSESELNAFKSRFEELHARVARLEEDADSLKKETEGSGQTFDHALSDTGNGYVLRGGESDFRFRSQKDGRLQASANVYPDDISHLKEVKDCAPNDFEVKAKQQDEKQAVCEVACSSKQTGPSVPMRCLSDSACTIEIVESDGDGDEVLITGCRFTGKETDPSNFKKKLTLIELDVKSGPKEHLPSIYKRKWGSFVTHVKDDEDTPTSKLKTGLFQELVLESQESPKCHPVLPVSSVRENVAKSAAHPMQDEVSGVSSLEEAKTVPRSEAEMILAFKKDLEFCMEAFCTLYRHKLLEEKTILEEGFGKDDALRACSLAKFLVDGHPLSQLNKSIKELEKYDSEAINHCRRLVTWHSSKLFDIYSKQKDPLFSPRMNKSPSL